MGLVSGARRRVAGLRRGELVKVAGVSAEHDLRLEISRGKMEQTPSKGDFDFMVADLLELAAVMGCEAPNNYEGVRHG
jgi:hypothetical protein